MMKSQLMTAVFRRLTVVGTDAACIELTCIPDFDSD